MTGASLNTPSDPFNDVISAAETYLVLYESVADFVKFECQFAAVVWLHRTVTNDVAAEVHSLRALRESGRHRVRGWEGESDLVLDETIGVLELDAAQIGAGAIVATCSSALESLFTDLLPAPSSRRSAPRGLVAKAQALATLWPDAEAAATVLEHVRWLAERRNSFAHRLIDEGGPWDTTGAKYRFDSDAVEETFERVGEAVTILSQGYDDYASRRGDPDVTARGRST